MFEDEPDVLFTVGTRDVIGGELQTSQEETRGNMLDQIFQVCFRGTIDDGCSKTKA
jgi:hypothetical protein